jgi:endogenous inhibitor of DNA gyrase (YacG/DUF329 family)
MTVGATPGLRQLVGTWTAVSCRSHSRRFREKYGAATTFVDFCARRCRYSTRGDVGTIADSHYAVAQERRERRAMAQARGSARNC